MIFTVNGDERVINDIRCRMKGIQDENVEVGPFGP